MRQTDKSTGITISTEIISDAQRASQLLCSEAVRHYQAGTGAKYPDTDEGLKEFRQATQRYFDYVRSTNMGISDGEPILILDIESWAVSCGISRATLASYRKRGGEWLEFIDFCKDCILSDKKARASSGKMPPVLFIFDATNNFNYRNASDAGHITDNVIENTQAVKYPSLIDVKGDSDYDGASETESR